MQHIRLLSYLKIRKLIGWLGILLSLIMWLGNFIIKGNSKLEPSISDYYYTTMGDVFVGVLFAIALFLYSYKGFDEIDDKITNAAAFCAVLVALFPTTTNKITNVKNVFLFSNPSIVGTIHLIAAGSFFIILGIYSFFWFTKFGKIKTKNKYKRNRIYRSCGIIMFGVIVIMIGLNVFEIEKGNLIFWLESIGLLAFGISWLVKGETILADIENN